MYIYILRVYIYTVQCSSMDHSYPYIWYVFLLLLSRDHFRSQDRDEVKLTDSS